MCDSQLWPANQRRSLAHTHNHNHLKTAIDLTNEHDINTVFVSLEQLFYQLPFAFCLQFSSKFHFSYEKKTNTNRNKNAGTIRKIPMNWKKLRALLFFFLVDFWMGKCVNNTIGAAEVKMVLCESPIIITLRVTNYLDVCLPDYYAHVKALTIIMMTLFLFRCSFFVYAFCDSQQANCSSTTTTTNTKALYIITKVL